jgi:hypothetical protein
MAMGHDCGLACKAATFTLGWPCSRRRGPRPLGKPIRIGEINSCSGLATVYTFPYKEGL